MLIMIVKGSMWNPLLFGISLNNGLGIQPIDIALILVVLSER